MGNKKRAPRNRTLVCTAEQQRELLGKTVSLDAKVGFGQITNKVICQDWFDAAGYLPQSFVDLLILDPPYNLTKNYHGRIFKNQKNADYSDWFRKLLISLSPLLKDDASIYICSDWQTSAIIFPLLEEHFVVRNRITWEREKGRGAVHNWKNNTEDIWFCTKGQDYYFDVDSVKVKRKVIAPYRDPSGSPKDWQSEDAGNFRVTHPSNIWNDITVPFWSMPENTDHPTQKPEKLIAKLVLASSRRGGFVFDPFLGSGTTAVVSSKLGRKFCGVEVNPRYCAWAVKRLESADEDSTIQGYHDGVFWERNTLNGRTKR